MSNVLFLILYWRYEYCIATDTLVLFFCVVMYSLLCHKGLKKYIIKKAGNDVSAFLFAVRAGFSKLI